MLNTMCFLDLEETVITSWDDPVLMNVSKLREFFSERHISEIHIFSFAVSHDRDRDQFKREMQEMLEQALDVKIVKVFTVEEIARIIRKNCGIGFLIHMKSHLCGGSNEHSLMYVQQQPQGVLCVYWLMIWLMMCRLRTFQEIWSFEP